MILVPLQRPELPQGDKYHVPSLRGFDRRALAELIGVVLQHRDLIEGRWNEYFG